MTKELVTVLRDDLDKVAADDVATREFGWAGIDYEIELTDDHYLQFEQAISRYLKVARPIKRKGRKAKSVAIAAPDASQSWSRQIASWATSRGYDWSDKAVRTAVREWAIENGIKCPKVGIVPRDVMEAFHAANTKPPHRVGKKD